MIISKVFTLIMNAVTPSSNHPPVGSRGMILSLLKTDGPMSAVVLGRRLKITSMAVRQHLYALRDQKLVCFAERNEGVGRPQKIWELTAEAERYFPDAHAELTVSLIEMVKESFGAEGLNQLMLKRTRQQEKGYRRQLEGKSSLAERVRGLVKIRTTEGYMAEAKREKGGGWLLIENHCPVCSAAKTCAGLCQGELAVFQTVLGDTVTVERSEHLLTDSRRCVYRISSKER